MDLLISGIICTHNRAAYLRKAIASLANQTLPFERYEIVVVDNGSTDETKKVVLEEFSELENIRYVHESKLGLSYARNAGWRNARGKYVAYLDDDGIACREWLEKILQVFQTAEPTPGCVGGRVNLIWEAAPPVWLSKDIMWALACLDWADEPITLDRSQTLVGVNFAFPLTVLEAVGGFDLRLDRRGSKLLSNGDNLIVRQIQLAGYSCLYDPAIVVWHHVAAARLKKHWFVSRYHWQGISDVILEQLLSASSRSSLFGSAWKDFRLLIKLLFGGYYSPRRIYWHVMAISFTQLVLEQAYLVGRLRQELVLGVSFRMR